MPPLIWDLTLGREPSRVGWPANVTDTIWFIEDPTVVDLTMPLGERHVISFRSAQIRVDDQRLVRGCYFFYEPESLDAAYQHAQNLCKEMAITNTAALDEWYKKRQIDKGDTGGERWVGLNRERGNRQPCTVEVRPAYNPAAPWQVRLGFLFDGSYRGSR